MAGRALEEPGAEPRLQLLDRIGDGGGGQAEILRGQAEAPALRDAGKDAHRIQTIHYPNFQNSVAG